MSRFASQEPKPRPTHTLIVPRTLLESTIKELIVAREIFTVEPTDDEYGDTWHLGIFSSALEHLHFPYPVPRP